MCSGGNTKALTGRMSISHMPTLVVTVCPTLNMEFPLGRSYIVKKTKHSRKPGKITKQRVLFVYLQKCSSPVFKKEVRVLRVGPQ